MPSSRTTVLVAGWPLIVSDIVRPGIVDAARLLIVRIGDAGHQRHEALERAAAGRQRLQLLAVGDVLHGGVLGLQNRGRRRDGQRLFERAQAQLRVDAHVAVGDDDVARGEGLKAGHRDDHLIGAGRDVGNRIRAALVGHDFAREIRAGVRRRDGRAGNDRAARIRDVADKRSVDVLREPRRSRPCTHNAPNSTTRASNFILMESSL